MLPLFYIPYGDTEQDARRRSQHRVERCRILSIGNQLGGNAQLRGRLRLQLDKHRIRTGVASGQKAPPIPPITEEKNIKAPPNKVAAAWASVSVIEAADNIRRTPKRCKGIPGRHSREDAGRAWRMPARYDFGRRGFALL